MGIYSDRDHRLHYGKEDAVKPIAPEGDNLFADVEEYDLDAHIKHKYGAEEKKE